MNIMNKYSVTVIVVIIILFVGTVTGSLYFLNEPLNSLIGIDKHCATDADCAFKANTCDRCAVTGDSVVAANKNWNRFCPFPDLRGGAAGCPALLRGEPKCVNKICENVKNSDIIIRFFDVDAAGQIIYVKNMGTMQVKSSDIGVYVNTNFISCNWDAQYIQPQQTAACHSQETFACTGSTTIRITSPSGAVDTRIC